MCIFYCGGRFLVSIHLSLLFSHWFWPTLCYSSYISHLIVILFLFRSLTPFFVSSVWPVHISGNQNQSPLQESDVPQAQEGATCLGWILAVWLYLFTFHGTFFLEASLKSRWNVGQRVHCIHYIFLAFLFSTFHLCPQHFTASQKTLPSFSQI